MTSYIFRLRLIWQGLISQIYNFPGAAAGVDLDSDIIIELSEHPNCFGAKLTCAGIGKGLRIAAHTQTEEYHRRHGHFQVLPGFSDYLLPALVSGQTGCITGTGNIIPKLIVKLYNTAVKAIETNDPKLMQEAQRLQIVGQSFFVDSFCQYLLAYNWQQSRKQIGALSRLELEVRSTHSMLISTRD